MEQVRITRDAGGSVNGVEQTGRVYITGPHFGRDVYSSTRDKAEASLFDQREAEKLVAQRWWSGNPRIEE